MPSDTNVDVPPARNPPEMATFSPIECYGAVGREVVFCHGASIGRKRSPSEISFSSINVDEDKLTRPLPCSPPRSSLSPPPSSATHIIPEDMFLKEAGHGRLGSGDLESTHPAAPIERFTGTLQTYESIAMALTLHTTRIQKVYKDFVPCPCSGVGSPAMSVASVKFIRPGTAPPLTEPPLPQLSVGRFPLDAFADPRMLLDVGHTPMSRFLADDGPYEWMAPTFDYAATLPTVEMSGDIPAQQNTGSVETSLGLSERPTQNADTAATDDAARTIGSAHASVEFIEDAIAQKHSPHAEATVLEAVTTIVKKLGDHRQKRVMKQQLPRMARNPRKRESPPQKKRRLGDDEL